jgi:protein-arginine kinase activator protein McsA
MDEQLTLPRSLLVRLLKEATQRSEHSTGLYEEIHYLAFNHHSLTSRKEMHYPVVCTHCESSYAQVFNGRFGYCDDFECYEEYKLQKYIDEVMS